MTVPATCRHCGCPLPPDAPGGVCPACLLRAGLAGESAEYGGEEAEHRTAGDLNEATLIGTAPGDHDARADSQRTAMDPTRRIGGGAAAVPPVGSRIEYFGDYELLAEIARGGMGVVYKARQVRLNRVVALKMILAGQFAGPDDVRRFQLEAESAAQLDHPGIVPIFEVGEHAGQHYFSMGYVAGESLARQLASGPLPPRRAAELLLQVVVAIGYAHRQGVIHRDLKPANILLDQAGQPRVTDFGLAKKLSGDSQLTGAGQILGTPSYMPPEQAAGRIEQITEQADIYALGAILYAMLTGRPPFQSDNPLDTVLQVIEREPVPVRALNPGIPLDLETICLKCLEKDRRKRYSRAEELADELRRYLAGQPILARPVGRLERSWRWCRRNPIVALLLSAVALSLTLGIIVSTWFAIEARERAAGETEQRREAEKQTRLTNAQLNRAEWLLYANELASAQREGELNNPSQAARSLERTAELRRSWEYSYLHRQFGDSLKWTVPAHGAAVLAVAISPDGRLLASAGRDRRIKVWNTADGKERATLAGEALVTQLIFRADSQQVAGVTNGGQVKLWDAATGRLQRELVTSPLAGLAADRVDFVTGREELVTHHKDGTIKVWDLATGQERQAWAVSAVTSAVSPDGRYVVACTLSGGGQSELKLLSLSGAGEVLATTSLAGQVCAVAFDHASQRLAVASFEVSNSTGGQMRIFDVSVLQAGSAVPRLEIPLRARLVQFRADDQELAIIGMEGALSVVETGLGTVVRRFGARTGIDRPLGLSASAELLVTGSPEGRLELWQTSPQQPPLRLPVKEWGYSVALSRDGRLVAAGSSQIVTVWEADTGRKVREIAAHTGTVHSVLFHPDGDKLLSGSWDATLRMWDIASGKQLYQVAGGTRDYDSLALSPDGQLLATGTGFTSEVRLYDARTGQLVTTLKGAAGRVGVASFSPDGRSLVTGGEAGEVIVWDLANHQPHWHARLGTAPIRSVAVSPDSLDVAALSTTGAIGIWQTDTGREVCTLSEPGINCVRFTYDGRRLVGGGADASLKFWTVDTGQKVCTLANHTGRVFSLACSPDGRWLATTGDAGAVFVHDVGFALTQFKTTPRP